MITGLWSYICACLFSNFQGINGSLQENSDPSSEVINKTPSESHGIIYFLLYKTNTFLPSNSKQNPNPTVMDYIILHKFVSSRELLSL